MQKERGSAIIIAVLLVAAIGAVAFGFGRVLNILLVNQSVYENGVGAYYSAESGVEEGFLRYRYDGASSALVPSFAIPVSGMTTPQSWLNLPNNVVRSNLTAGTVLDNAASTTTGVDKTNLTTFASDVTDPNSQYYDLRMGSLSNIPASLPGSISGDSLIPPVSADSPFYVQRDDTRKIYLGDLFSTTGPDLIFNFNASSPISSGQGPAVLTSSNCALIEVKFELQTTIGTVYEPKSLLYYPACNYTSPTQVIDPNLLASTAISYAPDSGAMRVYNLFSQVISQNHLVAGQYSKASIFIKPIGSSINYSIQAINNVDGSQVAKKPLSGAYSVITSTGYFGGVARTLRANVDLQSGSLYNLYDYVLYKNQ